jgi:hypothetical protein
MSWEPTRARWWKQYRGKRYLVSCKQLGTPATKEQSYRAANEWWARKRAEVDGDRAEPTTILSSHAPSPEPDPYSGPENWSTG